MIKRTFYPHAVQRKALAMLMEGKRYNLLEGGARSGKTALVCQYVIMLCQEHANVSVLFVRAQHNTVRNSIMDERAGSFVKTFKEFSPETFDMKNMNKSEARYTFPNNSFVKASGLDDRKYDNMLGFEWSIVVFEESSQILYYMFRGLCGRLANSVPYVPQQAICTLNPDSQGGWVYKTFHQQLDFETRKPLSDEEKAKYNKIAMHPEDNAEHLSKHDPGFLESLRNSTGKHYLRFYKGIYASIQDAELFTDKMIALAFQPCEVHDLRQKVIGVDPAGRKGKGDETGIVVAGITEDGILYVLQDASMQAPSKKWIPKVNELADQWGVKLVAYESNGPGDYVPELFPGMSTQPFHSGEAKHKRAETVSTLMERGKIRFKASADLDALVTQLSKFTQYDYEGEESPDRADALFIAAAALMPGLVKTKSKKERPAYIQHDPYAD